MGHPNETEVLLHKELGPPVKPEGGTKRGTKRGTEGDESGSYEGRRVAPVLLP